MSAPESQRLPPNPRRNKVAPDQRKRVATACNYCNVRRIRCSGDRPCLQCAKLNRECQYPASVEKITIPRSELEGLKLKCAALERQLRESASSQPSATGSQSSYPSAYVQPPPHNAVKAEPPLHQEDEEVPPTQGRLLRDLDGRTRYLGETSGATFLDALKSFMVTAVPLAFNNPAPVCLAGSAFLSSVGQYQTLDSRPILLPAVDPLWLPPQAEIERLSSAISYFVEDGNGRYPSGGLCFWGRLNSIPADLKSMVSNSSWQLGDSFGHRSLAFWQTVLAVGSVVSRTASNPAQDGPVGEAYFARARLLLGNPLDTTIWSPRDIPTLGLMSMYLAEHNRRDAAYISISNAMHIAIIHGIHKGWSVDESGKRIFWTIYTIDRWMSLLNGRPPTINDEAITLDLPQDCPGLPPAAGLRACVQLSRIATFICINSYQLTPRSFPPNSSVSYFDQVLSRLADWSARLPPLLQITNDETTKDRPALCLHLGANQLVILTIRPILLLAVRKSVADRFTNRMWNIQEHPQIHRIQQCSDMARRNLRLARRLRELSPAHKLLLPELHYMFNAAIILMLHQIIFENLSANDISEIAFAMEAFEGEARVGAVYALACVGILKDLLALVHRLRPFGLEKLELLQGRQILLPGEPTILSMSPGDPMIASVTGQHNLQMAFNDDIFQVLDAWLQDDDVQLYNSYLI